MAWHGAVLDLGRTLGDHDHGVHEPGVRCSPELCGLRRVRPLRRAACISRLSPPLASLVLDIIELAQAPYAQRLSLMDPRRELLGTWRGLARVYGTNATPRERELNRLEMLAHWTKVIVSLPGTGFPGERLMVVRYRHERQRLDLTQLRGGEHHILVDLLKGYEREIPVMCLPVMARGPRKAAPVAPKVSQQVCRAEIPQQGRQPVIPDAGSPTRTSPVPAQAVKKQVAASYENKLGLSMDESVFFGNRGDHWRNTRS